MHHFAVDPLAQQQQLLQFIMQQSLGAAAASSTHPAPTSTPQATQGGASMPMTPSAAANVKTEQPDPQVLMEQLQQQFKEVRFLRYRFPIHTGFFPAILSSLPLRNPR